MHAFKCDVWCAVNPKSRTIFGVVRMEVNWWMMAVYVKQFNLPDRFWFLTNFPTVNSSKWAQNYMTFHVKPNISHIYDTWTCLHLSSMNVNIYTCITICLYLKWIRMSFYQHLTQKTMKNLICYICESTIRTNELLTQQVSGLTVPLLPHHKRLVTSFTLIELCPIVILLEWQWFLLGNNTLKNRKVKWI